MRLQFGDLGLRQIAGELTYHQPLELDANVESRTRLLPARGRDDRNPVAAEFDQSLGSELSKRVAGDRPADAEPLAECILGKLGPRLERLLDDSPAKRAADGPD